MKTWIVVVLLLSTFSGVSGQAPGPITQFEELSLERTQCFGACPVYRVIIRGDGTVDYEGYKFVTVRSARATLSREQLSALVAAINDARYFSLRSSYRNARDGCPTYVTDHPSAITSVTSQGKTKKVHHNLGCRERRSMDGPGRAYPSELTALEERIDEIVNTARWVKGPRP